MLQGVPMASYLRFLLINILHFNIPGHSKVCHFALFSFSNQNITSSKVSVNDLKFTKLVQCMQITLTLQNNDNQLTQRYYEIYRKLK